MLTTRGDMYRSNLKRLKGHDCRQIDIKCEQLKDHVERQSREIQYLKESSDEVFWLQHQEIMNLIKKAELRKREQANMIKMLKEKDRIIDKHKAIVESYVKRNDEHISDLKARLSIAFNDNHLLGVKLKNNYNSQKKKIENLEKEIRARDKLLRERDEELSAHKIKIQHISKQLVTNDPTIPSSDKNINIQTELQTTEHDQEINNLPEGKENDITNDIPTEKADIEKELSDVKNALQFTLAQLRKTETELEETKIR